ncbi:MAG: 30S ribosomal protein S7 [Bernardetiaceae bacterium]
MRKSKPKKRILQPDPKFGEALVTQFVNNLMLDGKKSVAYRIFYDALDLIEEKLNKNNEGEPVVGLDVFKRALANVTPAVEVRSKRVGGATFQVPGEVRTDRKTTLAIKWTIRYARQRNEKTMMERLCNELIAASKNEGGAVKKKEDTHRMADANKAFSHFRF